MTVTSRRTCVRRDSVGASASSGSSPSSLTSPRRWAAKAEELQDLEAEPVIFPALDRAGSCPRSCSADHLGNIVDILGVPSGAPQFWDNPRRLILSAEKKKVEMRRLVISRCFTVIYLELVFRSVRKVNLGFVVFWLITCFYWSLLLCAPTTIVVSSSLGTWPIWVRARVWILRILRRRP